MSELLNETIYEEDIAILLDQYEEGKTVFIDAEDYDSPIHINDKNTYEGKLPTKWLGLQDKVISIIAHKKYKLDTYQNQLKLIDSEQMIDAYARIGLPVGYDHWSFGKSHIQQERSYDTGRTGLAYEIVINSDPCISYLMAGNTKTLQMLVTAHAAYGHNSFFKGNYLFKQFTKADEIIGIMDDLKEKVSRAEQRYGIDAVEELLDACHALQNQGIDKYTKPKKRSPEENKERREKIAEFRRLNYDVVLDSGVVKPQKDFDDAVLRKELGLLDTGEENILKYVAAYAPYLDEWQREIINGVSDIAQYFSPQGQTKVMNEGWASFWHYTIMYDLSDMGLIDSGMSLEFITSHCGVLFQRNFDHPHFNGINPYALGFAVFQDIKRICENPTDEDKEWFPNLAGKNWLEEVTFAMKNFKDESFIQQYLSPKVMRDLHLFSIVDDDAESTIEVSAIHNEDGYKAVRQALAENYNMSNLQPCIEIVQYDYRGDMSLRLEHKVHNRQMLHEDSINEVAKHLHYLWKKPVIIESVNTDKEVLFSVECASKNEQSRRNQMLALCR